MEQALNPDAAAARDLWFGSQAAADYLGIHRSTLFLAIQREHLVPDGYTPGGFARFREPTLVSYRQRLTEEAATGTGPMYTPIHTLAQLAHDVKGIVPALSQRHRLLLGKEVPQGVREVCGSAIAAISKPPVHAQMCLLALRTFDPRNANGLDIVAQAGIGPDFLRDYRWLRSQPHARFVVDEILESGRESYCPNTDHESPHDSSLLSASRQFIEKQGIRSYLGLPIVSGDLTLGLLLLLDSEPRQFSQHERAFLTGVTDQVALAINSSIRAIRLETYAQAGQLLTQIGLETHERLRGLGSKANRLGRQRDAISRLLEVFRNAANAESANVLNLPCIESPADTSFGLGRLTAYALRGNRPGAKHVQSVPLALGFHKNDKGLFVGEWQARGLHYNGLALGITLPSATSAAVGASWRLLPTSPEQANDERVTLITPEDHALFVTLAGACALVVGTA